MSTVENLILRIREAITEGQITKAELARKAGIRQTTLIEADRPSWNPRAKTLRKLEPHVPRRPRPLASAQRHDARASAA